MPHLSPPTLTHSEQKAILRATVRNPRDHLIYSLALGTGLRLAEIVGLDVGDVYTDDRTPRTRLRIRPEIAKGGRKGDVFLPDALMRKLRRFWAHKAQRREGLQPRDPLFCSQSRTRISKRRVQFAFELLRLLDRTEMGQGWSAISPPGRWNYRPRPGNFALNLKRPIPTSGKL